jgi:MFS family permease
LAQGIGALISPIYVIVAKRIGFRLTFSTGLALCALSLFASSFVPNEHYLFITYSIPFGIGSSAIFVLGSVLTGLYYPPKSQYHITATVAVSLGFPLGFLVLNSFTERLMLFYNNDWQKVQFIYSIISLVCMLAFFPFFTDKYTECDDVENERKEEIVYEQVPRFNFISTKHLAYLIRFLWLTGLLLNSCANNSILIHLVKPNDVRHFFRVI